MSPRLLVVSLSLSNFVPPPGPPACARSAAIRVEQVLHSGGRQASARWSNWAPFLPWFALLACWWPLDISFSYPCRALAPHLSPRQGAFALLTEKPHGLSSFLFSLLFFTDIINLYPTLTTAHRPAHSHTEYHDTHIHVDADRRPYASPIDIAEREYRERFRPCDNNRSDEFTVEGRFNRPAFREQVNVCDDTVEPARFSRADQKSKMGYYDEDGECLTVYP